MTLRYARLATAFCLLLIATFITSSLIATLTKPLENYISVIQSLLTQQHLLLNSSTDEPCKDSKQRCVLNVGINDQDFNHFFAGKTPLDPLTLLDGIRQLQAAGADPVERPAALVVDLDLSYGKNDKKEREQLFDGLITLSQTMPVVLSCPRNFAERPDQLGASVQDYMAYVTRHNAANVARHGGIFFFNPGMDRFVLNYDSGANHAGRVLKVALGKDLEARQRLGASYTNVCQNGFSSDYGDSHGGARMVRPDERYIHSATWSELKKGDLRLNYGQSIVLIGSNYLGADMFTFLGDAQRKANGISQISGAHLHAYIISDYLSPSRDTPEIFNALFDVLLGLLSGVVFCWLWRRVRHTGQHYAANLVAHVLFFAFAIMLPLSLMAISAVLLVNGTGFVSAGMVVSALLDAFFTPQEAGEEDGSSTTNGRSLVHVLAPLAAGLLLIGALFISHQLSIEAPSGGVYYEHLLAIPFLLSMWLLSCSSCRSDGLRYVAALSTAGYFLMLAFHADTLPRWIGVPQYAWLALPLLLCGIRIFADTAEGQTVLQQDDQRLSQWLRDGLTSPYTPLLVMTPLAYAMAGLAPVISLGKELALLPSDKVAPIIPLPPVVILGLPFLIVGTCLLYYIAQRRGHTCFDKHWRLTDVLAFSFWEGFKWLIALSALSEAVADTENMPWPFLLAVVMLVAITFCSVFDWMRAGFAIKKLQSNHT